MTDRVEFSDEELSAFLDGEAPGELSAAIAAGLERDGALRARLEQLRAGAEAFAAAMEVALESAPAMPELPAASPVAANIPWRIGLAGAAIGVIATVGLGWGLWPARSDGWREVVANYQSLYVTETLAPVDLTAAAQQADLRRISKELGIDLTGLPEIEGLTFKRAQRLGYKGRPLAQLTFLTETGGPVALCLVFTGTDASPDITAEVLSGLDTYSWTDNGFGVLLVGPRDETGLENAAEIFRSALQDAAV